MENPVLNQSPNQLPLMLTPDPYIQTIVLNDGTELYGSGGETFDGGDLWLWLDEECSYSRASELFENKPERTSKITLNLSEIDTRVYNNYTMLTAVQKRPDGKMSIRLNIPSVVTRGGE